MSKFERIAQVLGEDSFKKIQSKSILLFGLGGVGGVVAECLVRSGISHIGIVDGDVIEDTNFNRQLIALEGNQGISKVELWSKRFQQINTDIVCDKYNFFYNQSTYSQIDFETYDYIVDAIDDVDAKVQIIKTALSKNKKVISCMGTAKLLNADIEICDISKTHDCPLARAVRRELRKEGVCTGVNVVQSVGKKPRTCESEKLGSLIFVPMQAGSIIARQIIEWVIND